MKPLVASLAFAVLLGGCATREGASPKPRADAKAAKTTPAANEWLRPGIPHEERERHLAERFPGAKQLDLVKIVTWSEPRAGACWSEAPALDRAKIDVRYDVGGGERHATSLAELAKQEWTQVYRSPEGAGFERRARFRSIVLDLAGDLVCACAPSGAVQQETIPVELQLLWSEGKMPAVGAKVARGSRSTGLTPAITVGSLVTYDFPVTAAFPGGAPGFCGAHLALTVLVDPPIL